MYIGWMNQGSDDHQGFIPSSISILNFIRSQRNTRSIGRGVRQGDTTSPKLFTSILESVQEGRLEEDGNQHKLMISE